MGLREDILDADDLVIEPVVLPEWRSRTVWVRSLDEVGLDDWEAELATREGLPIADKYRAIRAELVARTACEADGTLLFKTTDVEQLSKKNGRAIDRLFQKAKQLNGLSDKDVEKIAKNSAAGPAGDSSSNSPENSASTLPSDSTKNSAQT